MFNQGRVNVATTIAKVTGFRFKQSTEQSFYEHIWSLPWLFGRRKFYELVLNVRVENPLRFVAQCHATRIVSDENRVCTIYIYPIFSISSTENFESTFSIKFEDTETSNMQYRFVLLNPTGAVCWESDTLSGEVPDEEIGLN